MGIAMLRTLPVFVPVALIAQVTALPVFDVASVKPSKMLVPSNQSITSGGIIYTNVTLSHCIETAWNVKPYQISGPEWLHSERYDIAAKAEGMADKDRMMLMLQALLADRFKLTLHQEIRERAAYVLVTAKNGPKIQAAEDDSGIGSRVVDGGIAFRKMSMPAFVDYLAGLSAVDRPVLDRTGLKGGFDFTLKLFEEGPGMTGFDKKLAMKGAEHIFTDLQEQVGLRLESSRAPVEILVIDHAEKVPTGN
jgi:uncharacterized protein (TIGR03435 family)